MRQTIISMVFAVGLAAPSLAEDTTTILVLDGSNSMWGQIDGEAKITIAQRVITRLLDDLPEDQPLGLTAYGHRQAGDCSDIETIVAPATGTQSAIAEAVRNIRPTGKTPMTDAVRAAAEAIGYTETPATVILVSDGIETCEADPCAAARAMEQAGVDFTAHVVGFAVTDAEALAQFQCLADETGGTFTSASDGDELARALADAAATPEPAPLPATIIDGPDSAPAGSVQTFTLTETFNDEDFFAIFDATGDMVDYQTILGEVTFTFQLPTATGTYDLRVLNQGRRDEVLAQRPITLTELVPALTPPATINAGETISVGWVGPGTDWDFLSIAEVGSGGGYLTASDYLTAANPITIAAPSEPGTYELRYIYGDSREVLVMQLITVE